MKKTILTTVILAIGLVALAQEEVIRNMPTFEKVAVSPKINLVLVKGDKESVHSAYFNISPGKIKVEVVDNKLRIYLDQARFIDKRDRADLDNSNARISIYYDVTVTAYVTYRTINELEMRGEEELTHGDLKVSLPPPELMERGDCA